jgi:biotin synthase-like enzyme
MKNDLQTLYTLMQELRNLEYVVGVGFYLGLNEEFKDEFFLVVHIQESSVSEVITLETQVPTDATLLGESSLQEIKDILEESINDTLDKTLNIDLGSAHKTKWLH